jgi:Fe2+ transport system protein FeoA
MPSTPKTITVADLKNRDRFVVKKVAIAREVGKRLVDMGFTRGAEGIIIRCAMLGDPIQVKLRGYDLSIRISEARGIEIEKANDLSTSGKETRNGK